MTYDLIAIDIDGTLVPENKIIAEPVKIAIQRLISLGKKVVLCTGRPVPGAKPYIKELGLNKTGDYMITYHGALVQRADTLENILHHQLTFEDFFFFKSWLQKDDLKIQAVNNHGVFSYSKDLDYYQLMEAYYNNLPLYIREMHEIDQNIAFSKFFIGGSEETIRKMNHKLAINLATNYTILASGPNSIEILNKKASKGKALAELANRLNIAQNRVMAIGDSGNDIDMVDYAGCGIAMGNAVSEVKAVANYVTDHVDSHGVATAINQHFFNDE